MTTAMSHLSARSRPWMAGVVRWATVVLPLAGGSVAFGEGGLVASSGVFGLASSLGSLSDAEIQAVDARAQSEAIAAQVEGLQTQVIPRPAPMRRVLPRPGGLPQVEVSPSAAAAVFGPARPRSAAELRPAVEPARVTVPTSEPASRPSVRAPAQIDQPRQDSPRPVSDNGRPPMPFSRLLSQVR